MITLRGFYCNIKVSNPVNTFYERKAVKCFSFIYQNMTSYLQGFLLRIKMFSFAQYFLFPQSLDISHLLNSLQVFLIYLLFIACCGIFIIGVMIIQRPFVTRNRAKADPYANLDYIEQNRILKA